MLYVLCALKPEAQAFIDKYKLDKSKKNENITLIISGVGRKNMFDAARKLVSSMDKDDIILNIGICGASHAYKVGELIDGFKTGLTCVDEAVNTKNIYEVVDMESSGFLEATKEVQNRYMYKIVSDNFEPQKVTKEKTKQLIFEKIDEVMEIIYG